MRQFTEDRAAGVAIVLVGLVGLVLGAALAAGLRELLWIVGPAAVAPGLSLAAVLAIEATARYGWSAFAGACLGAVAGLGPLVA
jgi:hypothetical protein